jgi:hypothetical protein
VAFVLEATPTFQELVESMVRSLAQAVLLLAAALPIVASAQVSDLSMPAAAPAADTRETRTALARQIIDVSDFDKVSANMMNAISSSLPQELGPGIAQQMNEALQKALKDKKITPAQQQKARAELPKLLDTYMRAELPKLDQAMRKSWAAMDMKKIVYDATVPFYVDNFDAAELRQILAFQSSPVGQKVLAKTPQLVGSLLPALQRSLVTSARPLADAVTSMQKVEAYVIEAAKK